MRPLIIGVGNDLRGDDGVGCEIARRLMALGSGKWDVCEAKDDALALMEAWQGREAVIIVDATQANGTPGKILRLDPAKGPLNAILNDVTSHGLGLGHSLELARSLAKLPAHCIVFVIEGISFELGKKLSPAVEKVIPQAMKQVGREAEKFVPGENIQSGN